MGYIGTDEGNSPLVLVVDDNAPERWLYIQTLNRLGYTALEASGAEHALEQAREHQPDIVIVLQHTGTVVVSF